MKIKLTQPAFIEGEMNRKGSVHDVEKRIAEKLIARGYAKPHKDDEPEAAEEVREEVDDATASGE